MDLNKAMIIGNLTRDPEVRTTPSGQSVANFGLATNRYWTDQSGAKQSAVEYHHIVAWGKLADICSQYLNKGKKVYIEGRLQTRDWEGQDGVKRNRTEIVAENLIMLSGGSGFGGGGGTSRPGAPASQNTSNEPTVEPLEGPQENSDEEIKVEDLPF
ncbi:single-stranded DNA-binding protein [Candidatus Parcubacteria bacterium]|nr:single-stranded DNA-binding protein [Patescibacteria group bacterium]MCG2693769.1 single-stranded DNA-binding protein [Candidatus Parcubacteria bacterium]